MTLSVRSRWFDIVEMIYRPSRRLVLKASTILCFCFVEKLAEQEKKAGVMQTSLEQKDERMNEMQRKIEVCAGLKITLITSCLRILLC